MMSEVKYLLTLYYSYRQSTNTLLQTLGNIHRINAGGTGQQDTLLSQLFLTHMAQLSLIFTWAGGNIFHIAWQSNYSYWQSNPSRLIPISHNIWDPNFGLLSSDVFSAGYTDVSALLSTSGLHHWLYTVGVRSETDLYLMALSLEILSISMLVVAYIHSLLAETGFLNSSSVTSIEIAYTAPGYRLNYHLSVLLGLTSILWSGHIIHVSIPYSRATGSELHLDYMLKGDWISYSLKSDAASHIHGCSQYSGSSILTFIGGIKSATNSLYLTDIAHHHLALGVVVIWSSHIYSSIYNSIGHRIRDISSISALSSISESRSLDLELSISLAVSAQASSYLAQHIYSLPAYVLIASDYVTILAIYVHHTWIASFCILGSMVHAGIYLIRDYSLATTAARKDTIGRILEHKASIISHISWVTLWLGFHTLLVYAHNDAVSAFGEGDKQLILDPIYAQIIQAASGKTIYGYSIFSPTYSVGAYSTLDTALLPIGPADLLAHHAIALGLHTTVLILIKGSLDARGSRLIPDKHQLGLSFPCDGPGRGGTCDVSTWDSMYLAMFWMLNTIAWTLFYFHWKNLTIWQSNTAAFSEGGTYLMAWFRDYLWFNSSPLIRGYSLYGLNDISVWAWTFLAAHLCWATGFMFLISWRGYWQELVETIILVHNRTPFVYSIWNSCSVLPMALSILEARFVGLVHFSVGLVFTYGAFAVGSL
jgi:photosystem I P700 chlorophyll a apoprotein A2